jgi:hypothetical protein
MGGGAAETLSQQVINNSANVQHESGDIRLYVHSGKFVFAAM